AVRTLEARSIIQSTRYVARHKARRVSIYEAEALKVDPHTKQVTIADLSDIKGDVNNMTIPYDILVYAAGAETQTFGIPGVKEHSCFLKELPDAENTVYPSPGPRFRVSPLRPHFSRKPP
ncbi:NADH:ubiquinone oxidoreductase, partial [Tulasnella sp. 424]